MCWKWQFLKRSDFQVVIRTSLVITKKLQLLVGDIFVEFLCHRLTKRGNNINNK